MDDHEILRGPKGNLDQPPDPEDGDILRVSMDAKQPRHEDHVYACQTCEGPVPLWEEHIAAHVREERGRLTICPRLVFCSQDCWTTWVTV